MHPVDMGHRSLGKSGKMGVVCCLGAGSEAHGRYVGARLAGMQLATGTERETVRHLCRESRRTTVSEARTVGMAYTYIPRTWPTRGSSVECEGICGVNLKFLECSKCREE
jgi:hypothetical protein